MKAAALALASLLGLSAACGARPPARASVPAAPSTAAAGAAPSTGQARADLPTVPAADGRVIPRVDGTDAAPPQITTRTTVLADNQPALVVTLPEAVLFGFGSAELRPDAQAALQGVVDLFGQHPGAQADVAGHTDAVGSADYNQTLSRLRAEAVVGWLVDHGVARAALRPIGYGASRPVAPNDTDADRQRNRRVELTIRGA
jgi:outer membrane protein OmpA-like peptidoglycan-associated protein